MLSINTTPVYDHRNKEMDDLTHTDTIILKFEKYMDDNLLLTEKISFILIAIFTILGNTLVLVATLKERSLHQPNKYFIACLAFADLSVGVFVAQLRVHKLHLFKMKAEISVHLCRFMVWIDTFSVLTSVCMLTFISFDRYLKINKPLLYK